MGEQSNALIAGLLVLSFGLLENKKLLFASLCVVLTVFIKLFGVVGFALNVNSLAVVLTGAVVFLLPLARIKAYNYFSFRYLTLASVLLWIVIFNHKTESPTYILAMTGVALWFIEGKKSPINIILLVLALVFTSLSSTDIFPRNLRIDFIQPYAIKAFPCILIWMKIIYDMMLIKSERNNIPVQLKI